ncbi:AAEL009834-PA [Aedes aegypti]|uniref:AAEL009834-PA n=1 Tax=Aedes aegypti TaxID=7159 RepID=Q16UP7_AEDAE|nr:AAEL009834-PA [Aedes aegypti]
MVITVKSMKVVTCLCGTFHSRTEKQALLIPPATLRELLTLPNFQVSNKPQYRQ